MEATGSSWEALALHLYAARHVVGVVNPSWTKAYGSSELLRFSLSEPVPQQLIPNGLRGFATAKSLGVKANLPSPQNLARNFAC